LQRISSQGNVNFTIVHRLLVSVFNVNLVTANICVAHYRFAERS